MIKFDINLIFGIIDIIVFYLLMKKFLFGRIKKVMDARKELIEGQLKEAEDKNNEADEKLRDYEEKIASYESEGKEIISDARKKADDEYNRIITSANADAKIIKEKAEADIAAESEKAKQETKEQIAALAIEVAEKVVKNSVSEKTNSSIIDEFLSEDGNEQ
ncbi:MAG: F0F1 ATP synthase subunit B [Eubacterium sp.]|nr:F0F1 ATP synthase subunit B [Eubacterium sp.]